MKAVKIEEMSMKRWFIAVPVIVSLFVSSAYASTVECRPEDGSESSIFFKDVDQLSKDPRVVKVQFAGKNTGLPDSDADWQGTSTRTPGDPDLRNEIQLVSFWSQHSHIQFDARMSSYSSGVLTPSGNNSPFHGTLTIYRPHLSPEDNSSGYECCGNGSHPRLGNKSWWCEGGN